MGNITAVTGTLQAMREQDVYNQEAAWDGAEETDSRRDLSQAGGFGYDLKHKFTFGTYGSGDGQFNRPQEIVVDSKGDIYVTDNGNNRIQKFTEAGWFLKKWGTYGSEESQFKNICGIAVDDKAGDVYVVDSGNHRIQVFTNNGNLKYMLGNYGSSKNEFKHPTGIAISESAGIFIADSGNHRISNFDMAGRYIRSYGTFGNSPGQFIYPQSIAVDSSNKIYVIDSTYRTQIFDITTFLIQNPLQRQGYNTKAAFYPEHIAISKDEVIWVSDPHKNMVTLFSPDGALKANLE